MSNAEMVLTQKQIESIDFEASNDLLIRGVAGSGKSVVLMKRAVKLNYKANQEKKNKKIVILTYTNSLVKYTKELVKLPELNPCLIEVKTIDSCCMSTYRSVMRKTVSLINDEERKELVEKAIQNHLKRNPKHRFHDIESEFWVDEFLWIKQKNLTNLNAYVDAERSGRGGKVRMNRDDKRIAYQLFDQYCILLKNAKKCDKEDLYAELISNPAGIPHSKKYDYVLVDEAQDLSVVMLKFAKMLSKESVTIAADKAQKIYSTTFSWKEIGIDIRGRSKSLDKPFRSTKQIVELAKSLLAVNRALQTDLSEFTDPAIPERTGSVPVVVSCENALDERDVVSKMIRGFDGDTIGILYRSTAQKRDLISWFRAKGIDFQEVKKTAHDDTDGGWSLSTPGVKLCTLHSSKGLEFDTVIIPMFTADVLPLASVMQGADDAQKIELEMTERSLLYVGMTRAKNDLCITFSGKHSPFLNDFEHKHYKYVSSRRTTLAKPVRTDIQAIKKLVPEQEKQAPAVKQPVRTAAQQAKPSYTQQQSYTRCLLKKANNGTTVLLQAAGNSETLTVQVNTHRDKSHSPLLGKITGETVQFRGKSYIIKNIT